MKKISILLILFAILLPNIGQAQTSISKPSDATIFAGTNMAILSWKNPNDASFAETELFRSEIPITNDFEYQAVKDLCDSIYRGSDETHTDTNLSPVLPYYYILFARDTNGRYSDAVILEKSLEKKSEPAVNSAKINSLGGVPSAVVNQVSRDEAEIIYNYNGTPTIAPNANTERLSLLIIAKSPQALTAKDKTSLSFFISNGTPTTIILGAGERAGVLSSYMSVFDKLPRSVLEWQDIIKIANGRWPNQRNIESENKASDEYFTAIYNRQPDKNNANDSSAITVIAYGLRPAARNMESEAKATTIFKSIFNRSPLEAVDWDLVRAIAYSGAVR
jgi:hypothetical protein